MNNRSYPQYDYPVRTETTREGITLSVFMAGEWHECPTCDTWTPSEIRDAIKYLEERTQPVRHQHLSQFI